MLQDNYTHYIEFVPGTTAEDVLETLTEFFKNHAGRNVGFAGFIEQGLCGFVHLQNAEDAKELVRLPCISNVVEERDDFHAADIYQINYRADVSLN